jgi:hypothetical protein
VTLCADTFLFQIIQRKLDALSASLGVRHGDNMNAVMIIKKPPENFLLEFFEMSLKHEDMNRIYMIRQLKKGFKEDAKTRIMTKRDKWFRNGRIKKLKACSKASCQDKNSTF